MPHSHTTKQILHRVDQPIAAATGLPNECYTTDAGYIADRDNVLGSAWACIGFMDELPQKNYSVPKDFMGLPLLITRDSDDAVRVFHNVCSHRGMQLSDKPCEHKGAIRCPYHAWSYGLNGELRATPNIGGYGIHSHPDFNTSKNGLKEVRSANWLGAIFINLSGKAASFEEYTAPIRMQWERFSPEADWSEFEISHDASKLQLTVKSNWKLAVENFLEAYHLPTVHPELNKISPLNQHYHIEYFDNGAGQGSLNYTKTRIDGMELPQLKNWSTKHSNQSEYPALYPNTFFGIHADQLFILYLQPVGPRKTIEHVRIYYVGSDAASANYAKHRTSIADAWDNVFREDVFAVERMQKGRASPAYQGGAFSPAMDEPTHHFHKWVARKLDQFE